jgi:cytochrome b
MPFSYWCPPGWSGDLSARGIRASAIRCACAASCRVISWSRRYLGLNPAGSAISMAMLVLLVISGVSGWMQVTLRFFGVAWVQDTHTYASDAVMVLVLVHVVGVLLMSIRQRENLVRAMITGWKRSGAAGR